MAFQLIPFLVGAGLTAAGAGLSIAGARKAQSAMEGAVAAEIARQRRYQQEINPIVQQRIGESDVSTAQEEIRGGQQARLAAYEQAQQRELQGGQTVLDRSEPTTVETGNQLRTASENIQRAALGGYTEWQLQQMIKQMRAQQQAGLIGAIARDSSAVLPTEVQAASRKGDTLQGLGALVGALGTTVGSAGALGLFPSGAATTPSIGSSLGYGALATGPVALGGYAGGPVAYRPRVY